MGLKDTNPSKVRWIEIEKVRELYPHLLNKNRILVVQKLPVGRNDLGDKKICLKINVLKISRNLCEIVELIVLCPTTFELPQSETVCESCHVLKFLENN